MVKEGLSDGGGLGVAERGHSGSVGPAKGKGRRINDDYFLEKVCVCKNINLVELATCSSGPALRPRPPEKKPPQLACALPLTYECFAMQLFLVFSIHPCFPLSPLLHQLQCDCSCRFTLCARASQRNLS